MPHISTFRSFKIKARGYRCPSEGTSLVMFGDGLSYVSLTDAEAELAIAELKAAIEESRKPAPGNTEGQ